MKTINPEEIESRALYKYMTASVAPRPIALASTIDKSGQVNLSPFSFFNLMGIDPPILVFAPNKRGTDHSHKHTALNVYEVPEVTINLVTGEMIQQISLASADFERGVNEFEKAGFTPLNSIKIAPPRVKESPAQFECKVIDIREYGTMVLIVCEVVMAHFSEIILDEKEQIDQKRTDWAARLGGDWYLGGYENQLFEVPRPKVGIGFDGLPAHIRNSSILTQNDLARLAGINSLPTAEETEKFASNPEIQNCKEEATLGCAYFPDLLHAFAHKLLAIGKVHEAWLVLLQVR